MPVFKSRSSRKFKSILRADPTIGIVQTPAGNAKVMLAQFREVIRLEAFVKVGDRIAKVRDGWTVIIGDTGFMAYRLDQGPAGPSIFTNAEMIERHAIYDTRGRNLTAAERQREGSSAYGMQIHFGKVS